MKVSLAQTFVCAGLADKQYPSTDLVASTVQLHTYIHTYVHTYIHTCFARKCMLLPYSL